METTDEEGWVTDPRVIDVLIALKEIRVGDQIRFQRNSRYKNEEVGHPGLYNGVVLDVVESWASEFSAGAEAGWVDDPDVIVCIAKGNYIGRKNIIAWKRPTKKDG